MSRVQIKFNPTRYKFAYRLSKRDCFRRLTGKCSLLLTDKEYEEYTKNEAPKQYYSNHNENSVHYCRLLKEDLLKNGFSTPIEILEKDCGHYSFVDGQHRTCISKTIGLKDIPAFSTEIPEPYPCRVCSFKKKKITFRIKDWFGKNDEFLY